MFLGEYEEFVKAPSKQNFEFKCDFCQEIFLRTKQNYKRSYPQERLLNLHYHHFCTVSCYFRFQYEFNPIQLKDVQKYNSDINYRSYRLVELTCSKCQTKFLRHLNRCLKSLKKNPNKTNWVCSQKCYTTTHKPIELTCTRCFAKFKRNSRYIHYTLRRKKLDYTQENIDAQRWFCSRKCFNKRATLSPAQARPFYMWASQKPNARP